MYIGNLSGFITIILQENPICRICLFDAFILSFGTLGECAVNSEALAPPFLGLSTNEHLPFLDL